MLKLANKLALVTGGSRSLGREIALRLAEAGADVCITYRERADAAEQTVQDIRAYGRKAAALQVDLNGTAQLEGFIASFRARIAEFGREKFDILVNNAGISCTKPIDILSEADLDAQYNTNYKSVVFLTRGLLNDINDGGRIFTVGSGLTRFTLPPMIGYGPIKAAVESFARYLAGQLGPRGITVNAVAPGALDTDFNAHAFEHQSGLRAFISSVTALGRVGKADDVGGVVAFLCSGEARWITGQRIEVSGGMFL